LAILILPIANRAKEPALRRYKVAEEHLSNLPPMSRASPLPAGLSPRPAQGELGLLLYQSRAAPRREPALTRLCTTQREDTLEQGAILVLLRLKLRRSGLSSKYGSVPRHMVEDSTNATTRPLERNRSKPIRIELAQLPNCNLAQQQYQQEKSASNSSFNDSWRHTAWEELANFQASELSQRIPSPGARAVLSPLGRWEIRLDSDGGIACWLDCLGPATFSRWFTNGTQDSWWSQPQERQCASNNN